MPRQLTIFVPALLLLASTVTVVWSGLNLVPIRFLWRYGLTPGCEPTGEVIPVQDIEFVVIGPGVCRIGSDAMLDLADSMSPFTAGDTLGRFCGTLGVQWGDRPEFTEEMPVHWCEFPRGFGIARKEVTNEQYARFLAANPEVPEPPEWEFEGGGTPGNPLVGVRWRTVNAYCAWLARETGMRVRLPSETEWEASCRGGAETEWCFGDDDSALGGYAWFRANSEGRVHGVATRRANGWGLHDLHGNAWEWCEDTFHESYGPTGPGTRRRAAPTDGSAWVDPDARSRVIRGGGWSASARACRSASRNYWSESGRCTDLGIRLALTLPTSP